MADGAWLLAQADARRIPLADGSVHCVVTSPPYYSLRDYGTAGQIGLESSPEAYVAALVDVFREVRRVLRDDGTAWVNLGDSYNADGRKGRNAMGVGKNAGYSAWVNKTGFCTKPKDRLGIPHRVVFALQADGWYWRDEIVWHKRAPMPESVVDRTTKAHEFVFLLTKRPTYYYDCVAVKEEAIHAGRVVKLGDKSLSKGQANGMGVVPSGNGKAASVTVASGRNLRSVWTLSPEPVSEAHFATMPTRLVEPCVLAGTSERGVCPACGAPWMREVERERVATRPGNNSKVYIDPEGSPYKQHGGDIIGNRDPFRHTTATRTLAWSPSCACPAADPVPPVVFDPFIGSGTVALVAARLGRRGIGIDLSRAYLRDIASRRILAGLRPVSRLDGAAAEPLPGQMMLFGVEDRP